MVYDKQDWADFPVGGTPLDAERLDHMEDGIFQAHLLQGNALVAAAAAQATADTANTAAAAADLAATTRSQAVRVFVQDENGTALPFRTLLNFMGAGVTAVDDPTNGQVDITIPGGVTVQDEGATALANAATLNFVGAGVTASTTGGVVTVTVPGGVQVADETTTVASALSRLDFRGAGVTVTSGAAGEVVITIPGGGGGGSGGHTIADEGNALPARTTLDFQGAGVSVTDDSSGNRTVVTVTGGGGGSGSVVGVAIPNFYRTGPLATLDGDGYRWYNDTGLAMTITSIRASVKTAPAGNSILVNVKVSGTAVTTTGNRPQIGAGQRTSGSVTAIANPTIPPGGYVTVDIDQTGSTFAGESLQVQIGVAA